jgi:hypothetical protein
MGHTYAAKRRALLRIGKEPCLSVRGSNPAHVKAREVWHDWGIFIFKYLNTSELYCVSKHTHVPVQINTALN